jgi:tRNA G18 (ribose-2'-O)-methylase SpoU
MVTPMQRLPYQVTAAVETSVHSVDLFDWTPRFPVCLVFGHEVEGVPPDARGGLASIPETGTLYPCWLRFWHCWRFRTTLLSC